MNMPSWKDVRPAWLLAFLILLGWMIGIVGDQFKVCPGSLPSICRSATYFMAQNNAIVAYLGQYFQLFTSIFVTDSPLDAGFNAIAVLVIDRLSEDTLNKSRYFLIFFFTAIVGNLFTLIQGPYYPASAGASGGIFGIIAAIFSYSWSKEHRIETTTLIFFVFVFLGSSFLIPDVNWVAHLGGAIGGFVCGPLLYLSLKNKQSDVLEASRSTQLTNLATGGLIAVATVFSIVQFTLFVH
ncbi:MAG: rhomboid family intramembrane serine protease [Thaumarchaeota archaeon]|nr:rhomboid family intramembrane serine protease [Nitrososphaerota archaeon]